MRITFTSGDKSGNVIATTVLATGVQIESVRVSDDTAVDSEVRAT